VIALVGNPGIGTEEKRENAQQGKDQENCECFHGTSMPGLDDKHK
jgi:hypothetical protein